MEWAEDEIATLRAENARLRAQLASQLNGDPPPNTEQPTQDAFRQTFLSTTSHELRASLNAIRNYSQLLRQLSDGGVGSTMLPVVEAITRQAEQALRVIDQLTNDPQPRTTTLRVRQRPLDLVPLIQRVVAEQQIQAKYHMLQLSLHGGPLIIQADVDMIEQLLLNMLGNACKYSAPGTEIQVRLERRDVTNGLPSDLQAKGGRWAVISISDSGIGIALDEQERVFDKFFRGRNAATLTADGLGIGLYISRLIAQRHGGSITLQSVLEQGSRFTVFLPIM